jgi:hypothetical protein
MFSLVVCQYNRGILKLVVILLRPERDEELILLNFVLEISPDFMIGLKGICTSYSRKASSAAAALQDDVERAIASHWKYVELN